MSALREIIQKQAGEQGFDEDDVTRYGENSCVVECSTSGTQSVTLSDGNDLSGRNTQPLPVISSLSANGEGEVWVGPKSSKQTKQPTAKQPAIIQTRPILHVSEGQDMDVSDTYLMSIIKAWPGLSQEAQSRLWETTKLLAGK